MASRSTNSKWAIRLGIVVLATGAAFALRHLYPANVVVGQLPEHAIPVGAVLAETEPSQRPVIPPEQLYHRSWAMVQDMFFDKTFCADRPIAAELAHKAGSDDNQIPANMHPEWIQSQDWNRWRHRYDGKLKTQEDAHKAIETMIASLGDPYTRFLTKEAFDDEKDQIAAHLYGVGMQLGMNKEHKVVIIAPIQDTPAYRAGVHPGDEIIEVDHKPVKGQSLDQVVKQIRGPAGSKVELTLMRGDERKIAEMTRAEVPIRAVATVETLPGDVGYIRLDSFISHKANDEMHDALKKVATDKGLILDLRNNPGGLLSNAIEIANMFLDHGTIVSTVDADGYKNSTVATHHPLTTQPLVVLINGGSASASEILSGALHDNHRAELVGQKSFGKGLVQSINRLEDGSGINITIARYLTPNDTDINKQGITPDVAVELKDDDYKVGKGPWWIDPSYTNFKRSPTDGKDVQLAKAEEVMKAELAKGNTTVASDRASSNLP